MLHFTGFLIRNISSIESILKNILQTQSYLNYHTIGPLLPPSGRAQKKRNFKEEISTGKIEGVVCGGFWVQRCFSLRSGGRSRTRGEPRAPACAAPCAPPGGAAVRGKRRECGRGIGNGNGKSWNGAALKPPSPLGLQLGATADPSAAHPRAQKCLVTVILSVLI